jgi:hypothetical protein
MTNLRILRLLLRRGAKPNQVFDQKTSWEYALLAIDHLLANRIETPKHWTEPLIVLLEHGVNPNQYMDDGDSALMVVCRNIDEDHWLLDGRKGLIEALIRGGAKMEQDELKWVGKHCGKQIRTFLEKTLAEIQISSSRLVKTDLWEDFRKLPPIVIDLQSTLRALRPIVRS